MIPLRDDIPARRAPLVTWAIIAVNVIVFLHQIGLPEESEVLFVYLHGFVPERYSDPAWGAAVGFPPDPLHRTLLTSTFLHGGWLHLLGNMWTLWIFGDNVEDRMGRIRFLLFYLACGLAAGLVHWFTSWHSQVPTVGASGAIAGVLGAYFLLFRHARVLVLFPIVFIPLFFEIPAVVFLVIWFALQLVQAWGALGMDGGGVAWWAHVGGFAAGITLHRLFLDRHPPDPIARVIAVARRR